MRNGHSRVEIYCAGGNESKSGSFISGGIIGIIHSLRNNEPGFGIFRIFLKNE